MVLDLDVVLAGGSATTKICGQPPDSAVVNVCVVHVCEEYCAVHLAEGIGEIHSH